MNTVQDVNGNTQNAEIEEVQALEDNATDEQKAEYYTKLEDRNKQLFARAKKAEGFEQVDGKWVKKTKPAENTTETKPDTTIIDTSKLSQADIITLARTDIADEDIPEVLKYAKMENISIAEALKSTIVKTILETKAEQRKVAEGTSTGGGKRGNAKVTDELLISNARAGKLPESEEDMARLARLQLGIK